MSVKTLLDLSGRVALVTGGSRGLGLQIAEALGEMGAKLAISARKKDELDQAVAHLGGSASAFVACQVAIDTPRCTRIAVGSLAADTDIENRSLRQRRVFDEMYECYRARKLGEPKVEWIYPVYDQPKSALVAALPSELLGLTWSCRRPVASGRACGACKACRAREKACAQGLRGPAEVAQNQAS